MFFAQIVITKLRVSSAHMLQVIETENGIDLTPYDLEFGKQVDVAETSMHAYTSLRKFAK